MEVRFHQTDTVTVVAVDGELSVATAAAFLRRVRLVLASVTVPLVVVDLGRVRRVDSSGFAGLVALLRDMQRRRGDVCLVGLAPPVRLLLEVMQLHLVFEVRDDVASGVEALTASRPTVAAPTIVRRLLGRIRPSPAPVERRVAS